MSLPDPQASPLLNALAHVAATGNSPRLRQFLAGDDLPAVGGNLAPQELLQRVLEEAPHLGRELAPVLAEVLTEEIADLEHQPARFGADHRWLLLNGLQLAAELPADSALFLALKKALNWSRVLAADDRVVLELPLWRALVFQQTDDSLESEWLSLLQQLALTSEWTPAARSLLIEAWRGVLWLPPALGNGTKDVVDFDRLEQGLFQLHRAIETRDSGGDLLQYALDLLTDTFPRSSEFWQHELGRRIGMWPLPLREATWRKWPQLASGTGVEDRAAAGGHAGLRPRTRGTLRTVHGRVHSWVGARDAAQDQLDVPIEPGAAPQIALAPPVKSIARPIFFSALLPHIEMEERQSLDWGEKFLDTASRRQLREREDESLMRRIADHDQEAFARLYDLHYPTVFSLLFRILQTRADAEEVLQDVFLHVWMRANHWDPSRSSPRGWLLMLTRSHAVDHLRLIGTAHRFGQGTIPNEPLELISWAERSTQVSSALHLLSPEQRRCAELAFFEGLTHTQIAERLGTPLGTVKSRILIAMNRLRAALQG